MSDQDRPDEKFWYCIQEWQEPLDGVGRFFDLGDKQRCETPEEGYELMDALLADGNTFEVGLYRMAIFVVMLDEYEDGVFELDSQKRFRISHRVELL